MKKLNAFVKTEMQSDYLSLEIEEVVRKIAFIDGRKAYSAILDEKSKETWTRYNPISPCDKLKLRGVAWSKQEKRQRVFVEETLKKFMLSEESGQAFYKTILAQTEEKIRDAIIEKDLESILQYAERVKLSSEKSLLVKHLKKYYPNDVHGKSFVNVVVMKGEGIKT